MYPQVRNSITQLTLMYVTNWTLTNKFERSFFRFCASIKDWGNLRKYFQFGFILKEMNPIITYYFRLKSLETLIWFIFLSMGPNWKYPLRSYHLLLYVYQYKLWVLPKIDLLLCYQKKPFLVYEKKIFLINC